MVNDANMRESMEVRLLEFDVMNNGVKIIVAVPKKIISPRSGLTHEKEERKERKAQER